MNLDDARRARTSPDPWAEHGFALSGRTAAILVGLVVVASLLGLLIG